jgi:hypothetical protein
MAALVEAYNTHQYEVLVARRVGSGDPDAVFVHAVAALALLHALVDRLQAARWSTIRAALAADASRAADVASACGLDGSEVAAGLRSWADGQTAAGLMSRQEWGSVELMARSVGRAR